MKSPSFDGFSPELDLERVDAILSRHVERAQNNAVEKLVHDASIEHIKCITRNEDYTHYSINFVMLPGLLIVAPLQKDRTGMAYDVCTRESMNYVFAH